MNAFVLEILGAGAWRQINQLYWLVGDADFAGQQMVANGEARGYRVVPVRVCGDAVITQIEPVDGAIGATLNVG